MVTQSHDTVIDELIRDHGWIRPVDGEVDQAIRIASALAADIDQAANTLRKFYDPNRNFAGRTFLDLGPQDANEIGPADLLAITLMNVSATPHAVRKIHAARRELGQLLEAVPPAEIQTANVEALRAAGLLYVRVKALLGTNPWVVASKLCARKRPTLIPTRDTDVIKLLGLANEAHTTDWIVYRRIASNTTIMSNLDRAAEAAEAADVADVADVPRLRLLDTLLWMKTRGQNAESP